MVHTAFSNITTATHGAVFANTASRIRVAESWLTGISGPHFHISGIQTERAGRRSVLYTDKSALVTDGTWRVRAGHFQSVLPLTAGTAMPWLLPNDARLTELREVRPARAARLVLQGCATVASSANARCFDVQVADAAAAAAGVTVVADEPGISPLFAEPPAEVPAPELALAPQPPPAVNAPAPTTPEVFGPQPTLFSGEDDAQAGQEAPDAETEPPVAGDRDGGGSNTAAIAAGVAAAAVVIIALAGCALLLARRRRAHPTPSVSSDPSGGHNRATSFKTKGAGPAHQLAAAPLGRAIRCGRGRHLRACR